MKPQHTCIFKNLRQHFSCRYMIYYNNNISFYKNKCARAQNKTSVFQDTCSAFSNLALQWVSNIIIYTLVHHMCSVQRESLGIIGINPTLFTSHLGIRKQYVSRNICFWHMVPTQKVSGGNQKYTLRLNARSKYQPTIL